MQLTCPCCHAHVPLEAALQDEAGRELVGMLAAMQPGLALPLVHYLAFFRPAKQQLGWGRALRLAREVVNLAPFAPELLMAALIEAARALDEKRQQPGWKPMGNHNYLKRVMEGLEARPGAAVAAPAAAAAPAAPRGKQAGALISLESLKR
jgi:hypothetical protein